MGFYETVNIFLKFLLKFRKISKKKDKKLINLEKKNSFQKIEIIGKNKNQFNQVIFSKKFFLYYLWLSLKIQLSYLKNFIK